LAEWLARRRALGQDLYDEVWEGVYHVPPAPHRRDGDLDDQMAALLRPLARERGLWPSGPLNIGRPDDYRVPDRAYLRSREMATYAPTAAVVVEILSPDDQTLAKLGFYADRGVEEVAVIDPVVRTVQWYANDGTTLRPAPGSSLLGITSGELAWPPG
jgi:Uma2 family endonuclease